MSEYRVNGKVITVQILLFFLLSVLQSPNTHYTTVLDQKFAFFAVLYPTELWGCVLRTGARLFLQCALTGLANANANARLRPVELRHPTPAGRPTENKSLWPHSWLVSLYFLHVRSFARTSLVIFMSAKLTYSITNPLPFELDCDASQGFVFGLDT